ncbi:MAG TPA: nucleoside permease [Woeseiaceae bacterium]
MSLKTRLVAMNFLQYFIWGSWLITIGAWWFQTRHWSGAQFGAIYSTIGIAAIVTPSIAGIIADKWLRAERLYGVLHLLGAATLLAVPAVDDPGLLFWLMLVNMCFYMPTISLAIAVSYSALKDDGKNIVTDYPPIRVWGTVGFIVAMWTVSLLHLETTAGQFYVAAASALVLGLYAFTLPKCPPRGERSGTSLFEVLGLSAFKLFRQRQMAVFFVFAMLLGAALQLTNMYGDTYLHDFGAMPEYRDALAVRYPAIIMSISQVSETLFILAIPFVLGRFGIKKVMLISLTAWVFRFGLFAYGNPGDGLWMIVLSCIVYGMAFDFYNISGSIFVETRSSQAIRASAQGLFMMMTNGFGAMLGSVVSGLLIQHFFTDAAGDIAWRGVWLSFAGYALVVAVLFSILFRHKHEAVTGRVAHAEL